ncbi:hypothetical protein MUCCIDRAFT_155325 [Mucor lusitanicus CBS 277.49]|uniref:Uncharacterized protein n=2 Tax=Mucor circinelloides f. lusitanicus TaxID=29924 RepID=A0A162ZHZ2_MUCCL|nr:hypothetical protein MUCCIDRAFT_155325 [Mucor lusitanicus CBS 277.49]
MTGSKKPLDKDDDDPYGIASYAPQSVIASPKAMTSATFDLLAPIASGLTSQPNTTATPHWSHSSADTCKTTSDQKQPKSDAADDENDEWGDWAF